MRCTPWHWHTHASQTSSGNVNVGNFVPSHVFSVSHPGKNIPPFSDTKEPFFFGSCKNFNQTRWDRKFPRLTCLTCRPRIEFVFHLNISLNLHFIGNGMRWSHSTSTSTLNPHIFEGTRDLSHGTPSLAKYYIKYTYIFPHFPWVLLKWHFFAKYENIFHWFRSSDFSYSKWLWVGEQQAECGNGNVQNVVHFIFRLFRMNEAFGLSTANLPNIFPNLPFRLRFSNDMKIPFLNWCRAKSKENIRQITWIGFERSQQRVDWRVGIWQHTFPKCLICAVCVSCSLLSAVLCCTYSCYCVRFYRFFSICSRHRRTPSSPCKTGAQFFQRRNCCHISFLKHAAFAFMFGHQNG